MPQKATSKVFLAAEIFLSLHKTFNFLLAFKHYLKYDYQIFGPTDVRIYDQI